MGYNRERFLLRCVAWIIGVQFMFYIAASVVCADITHLRADRVGKGMVVGEPSKFCNELADKLQNSVEQGLAVLLALLGGGALALSEGMPKERPETRKRVDPRKGGDDMGKVDDRSGGVEGR